MHKVDTDTAFYEAASERTATLYQESQDNIHRRTDRMFANLMLAQWLAGIAAALWISPRTWIGDNSQTHWHVWAAIFMGGAITSLPVFLAWQQPGRVLTRHVIAIAQMLSSALLIHLTGGRIETHFHVFGSLAFLAFYRDWRVLITATVVVALDHMARGLFWPQSVFGVLTASPWRWLEHAGWVIFEDTFLFISIRQGLREMFEVAARRAKLEAVNASIERQVAERTAELTAAHRELQASEQRFRMLSASAPIGIFETDAAGHGLYTNQYWQKITGMSLTDSLGDGWRRALHPADVDAVWAEWKSAAGEGRGFSREFRVRANSGEVRWVNGHSTAIRSAAGEIIGYVGTVEDITERKRAEAELEKAHKELLEISRQAGMAEVATGVLHNVGNVLNSVNVASTCVADSLRNSRSANLSKVVAMLREHEADLGAFLTNDPKGKQLPGFLGRLAEHLASEQSMALNELAQLQKNIEHIKDIVSMQQSCAKVSGLTETLNVTDLVVDALTMNSNALDRHNIQVSKEFEYVPSVTVEKHKVLQILVNLVRNAKHACNDSGRVDKRLTVRVSNGDDRVRIAVIDNGIGIPPENLTRIFGHGFTTKKDGHGFGLHSGALAAKQLGGSLNVHSDGSGKGATFTLELPLASSNARVANSQRQEAWVSEQIASCPGDKRPPGFAAAAVTAGSQGM